MSKREKSNAQPEGRLDDALYQAARSLGWLIEKTEEEVCASELDEDDVELPESLADPFSGIDTPRERCSRPTPAPLGPTRELQEGFARAAREGSGQISRDVEERMRRDREAAREAKERDDEA